MIKEIISILVSLLLSIVSVFTGVHNGGINEVQTVSKGEYAYANEIGSEIVRCLREKDKKALNNLYCDKIKDTEYLQKEIDIIFDYIDGNGGLSIEDSTWSVPTSHGSFNGGKSIAYVSCKYDNIIFIKGKEYELCFTAYQVLRNHLEYQGVNCIFFLEHMTDEILDKSFKYKDDSKVDKKIYLGFDFFDINYDNFQYFTILPKELSENSLFEVPDNLEEDR